MITQSLREIVAEMGKFYVDSIFPLYDDEFDIAMSVRHRREDDSIPGVEFVFAPRMTNTRGLITEHSQCPFLSVTDNGTALKARCHSPEMGIYQHIHHIEDNVNLLIHQFLQESGFDRQRPPIGTVGTAPPLVATYLRQHRSEASPEYVDLGRY